jgi:hypothetical protein
MFNPGSSFAAFQPAAPAPTEPPKFNAAQLQKDLGITEAAAKLLTDGGKLSLTEKEVLEKLQSSDNKIYDISRKSDSKPDSFENRENANLIKRIDGLDHHLGDISIKDGNLAWGAAGATESEARRDGFVKDIIWNPPSKETVNADTGKIQSALEKTGGDKNQKIEYQGVLLTDNSDMGSANVRLYSVGEPDNARYVGIKQGDGQILSQKELKAHLEELNKTRAAEGKPELNLGKIGEILKSGKYLDLAAPPESDVPPKP